MPGSYDDFFTPGHFASQLEAEGLPVGGLWQHPSDHFTVQSTTKEQSMSQTTIKISAGERGAGPLTRLAPFVDAAIETEGVESAKSLLEAVKGAVGPIAAAAGISPTTEVQMAGAERLPTRVDGVIEDAPDEASAEHPAGEDIPLLNAANRRMYNAIGTSMVNLKEIGDELANHDDERVQVLARAIKNEVVGLVTARDGS